MRLPAWPIPFPPPQQVDTREDSGYPPRGRSPPPLRDPQHPGNNSGPEHAALPILRSSPEGEPRSCGTHHPALGNPPAASRWLPKHTAESPGCQAASQSPGTPEPAQSEPPDRYPLLGRGAWGRASRAGTALPTPRLKQGRG